MHPDIAVVMITAQATTETAVRALNEGARAYIIKPFSVTATMSTVREILQEQRCSREQRVKLEQLRQYATELEAQNEELDAFAHTVAHDLKAFSYRISGYAEALLHDEHDPLPQNVQQQCLRIMAQGARRMSTLIDELLLFAQVSGEEVDVRPLAMGEIVARAQRRLGFLIEDRQAELIVRGDWPTALGHAPWVEEIWVNYISNAVKYGGRPREGIPPRVELGHDGPTHQRGDQSETSRPGTGSHIRLWIRDNGPGLTPEEQAHVFTPFTRQRQLETTGHGLGLSIVQRIVNKLGGEVGVESQAGRGSTFSFTLPRDHGWKPRSCSEERGAQ
jgi:signal transduction histidine kinase